MTEWLSTAQPSTLVLMSIWVVATLGWNSSALGILYVYIFSQTYACCSLGYMLLGKTDFQGTVPIYTFRFPDDSDGKESPCNARDPSSIPELGRSPRAGNGSPLQCSFLENSMNRGVWQATVHRVTKSWTQLSI